SPDAGEGGAEGRRGKQLHFTATGGSGDLFWRVDQGKSCVPSDSARAGNSSAAWPRRQDRRSRQCARDFLQDGGQHHLIAQAEAWREGPFGPYPNRGGDGAGLRCRPPQGASTTQNSFVANCVKVGGPRAFNREDVGAPCPACNFASPYYPLRLMKGLQLTRRHDCIPISTWLHNQVVSRIVIAMP